MWFAVIVACNVGEAVNPSNCGTSVSPVFWTSEAHCVEAVGSFALPHLESQGLEAVGLHCLYVDTSSKGA